MMIERKKNKKKKKDCSLVDPMTVRFIDFDLSKRIETFFCDIPHQIKGKVPDAI